MSLSFSDKSFAEKFQKKSRKSRNIPNGCGAMELCFGKGGCFFITGAEKVGFEERISGCPRLRLSRRRRAERHQGAG